MTPCSNTSKKIHLCPLEYLKIISCFHDSGLHYNKITETAPLGWIPVNSRLFRMRLRGSYKVSSHCCDRCSPPTVSAYTSTEHSPDAIKNTIHRKPQGLLHTTKRGETVILPGDECYSRSCIHKRGDSHGRAKLPHVQVSYSPASALLVSVSANVPWSG